MCMSLTFSRKIQYSLFAFFALMPSVSQSQFGDFSYGQRGQQYAWTKGLEVAVDRNHYQREWVTMDLGRLMTSGSRECNEPIRKFEDYTIRLDRKWGTGHTLLKFAVVIDGNFDGWIRSVSMGDGKWGRFLQDKLASLILVRNPAN